MSQEQLTEARLDRNRRPPWGPWDYYYYYRQSLLALSAFLMEAKCHRYVTSDCG